MKDRIPLVEAEELAQSLVQLIGHRCRRIEVLGSIRRRKADVGDIEILYEPLLEQIGEDLFGEPSFHNASFAFLNGLKSEGVLMDRLDINGRPAWGERYQRAVYRGFALDLFACIAPNQWGIQKVIRTGDAEFSRAVVTSRLEGGLMPPGCRVGSGHQFFDGREGKVEVPDEETFFRLLEIDFIEPERRRWPL